MGKVIVSSKTFEFFIVNETDDAKDVSFFNKDNMFKADEGVHVLYVADDTYLLPSVEYNKVKAFMIGKTELHGENICGQNDWVVKDISLSVMVKDKEHALVLLIDPYQVCRDVVYSQEHVACYKKDEYNLLCRIPPKAKLFIRFWLGEIQYHEQTETNES